MDLLVKLALVALLAYVAYKSGYDTGYMDGYMDHAAEELEEAGKNEN